MPQLPVGTNLQAIDVVDQRFSGGRGSEQRCDERERS
jgi:hypothetical protein